MGQLQGAVPWIAAATVILIVFFMLRKPLGILLRLFFRSCGGLAILAVLQPVGSIAGIALGVNLINAVVLGVLGVPGLGLLLLLQWTLR